VSVETGPIAPRQPAPPTAYKQSADQALIAELRRLENAQADLLLDHFGAVQPSHRLLDAGSGRGGTSFMAGSSIATGVEDAVLTAYREGSFHYLLIVADYIGW
jgi:geranyl diphosphate 2-C-methyltransferase